MDALPLLTVENTTFIQRTNNSPHTNSYEKVKQIFEMDTSKINLAAVLETAKAQVIVKERPIRKQYFRGILPNLTGS